MPQLQPVPGLPGALSGDVDGFVVSIDPENDNRATVMRTAELVYLTEQKCYMAAEMLLEAAEALRMARAAG